MQSSSVGEVPPCRFYVWSGVEPVLSMRTYRDIDIRSLDHEPRADRRRRCRQDDRMSISRYGRIESTGFTPVQVSARRGGASPRRALWPRCVLIARSALLRCQSTFAGTTRREAHDPVIGCRYLDTDASTALAPHQSKHQLDETVLRQPWRFARRCVLIARSALLLCQLPSRHRGAGMQS